MAGGGVKGGIVHGATDEIGFHAVEDRHYVTDVHATILNLMGLNDDELRYLYAGRMRQLTDIGGTVLDQIIA